MTGNGSSELRESDQDSRIAAERAPRVVLVSRAQAGPVARLLAAAAPDAHVRCVPALARCAEHSEAGFDLALVDATGGDFTPDALAALTSALPSLAVVVLCSRYDAALARAVLEAGGQDCLPLDVTDATALGSALCHARWRQARIGAGAALPGIDPLTGLLNRASFESQLDRSIHQSDRAGRQLAVLLFHVDGLSEINDGVGHDVGDLVLSAVAARISGGTRKADVVARVGGSNFALLLHDVSGEHAPARVGGYLLRLLAEPITIKGHEYWTGSNLGIAMFPRDGQSIARLIGHAEVALHQARTRGRGEFRFHNETMNSRARKRLVLENNLRRALQRGELRVAYQPQVDTRTGVLRGCEALARWSDPDLGDVSPGEFIPVAEQTGLIVPLGEWVLRQATTQLGLWKREGLRGLRVSVNVSAHQLERDDFRETVARALWDADLEPADLVLEVTESALVDDTSAVAETLGELARRGIAIALDDFGTGFSSLAFLKRFPLECVKIDRSFMHELVFDPDDRAIVVAILSIARQLRLSVIAEGVETEVQRAFLEKHGCDEIQGFLISPAVSPEEFEARFASSLAAAPGAPATSPESQ